MNDSDNTTVKQAIANTQKLHDVDGNFFILKPEGYELETLDRLKESPRMIMATPSFLDMASFISYVERFSDTRSTIFADDKQFTIKACIDYHEKATPSWCTHTAHFNAQPSKEWKTWSAINDQVLNQEMFAEFLETNAKDVVQPNGAELLEIALKFSVIREAKFGSAKKLSTGEFQFSYSEENKTGTVELPEIITLGIAPFHNGEPYEVKARLRYRLREGDLTFRIILIDPEKVAEHAFNELVTQVDESLQDLSVYKAVA